MVSQTPASLEKPPWSDNQDNVAYDEMALETFEGGKGADDENEWQDEAETLAGGSKATVIDTGPHSVNTVPSDSGSRETGPTSQPLPWSPPDPRTQTPGNERLQAEEIHSPPTVQRVINQAANSEKQLTGLAKIEASREDMIRGVQASLKLQRERESVNTVTPTPAGHSTTDRTTPQTTSPAHAPAPNPDAQSTEWQTIPEGSSASKRKAKASPKSTSSSIRKPEVSRSIKKQLFEPQPATPNQEAPAQKN
jgi:hypothetical protein